MNKVAKIGEAVEVAGKSIKDTLTNISEAVSPIRASPYSTRHRLSTVKMSGGLLDSESPFLKKQEEINKPRRRSHPPRSKQSLQQFVQSDIFQETFNGLI